MLLKPSLDWHRHPRYGQSVSNPSPLPTDDGFRLCYSANLVHLDDCGFNEPWRMYFNARNDWHWSKGSEHIGLAEAAL